MKKLFRPVNPASVLPCARPARLAAPLRSSALLVRPLSPRPDSHTRGCPQNEASIQVKCWCKGRAYATGINLVVTLADTNTSDVARSHRFTTL